MNPEDILHYWFEELQPRDWWRKDEDIDRTITQRFGVTLTMAVRGEFFAWRDAPRGRLAEIIVLDQFSRHIHRDTPAAFAADAIALVLAQEAVRAGADRSLVGPERAFLFMPYMHSESRVMQAIAIGLFDQPGLEDNLRFAHAHRDIIERFGRYPHRNRILGRISTPEEELFLQQPGSGF
ncbi:MAG: DUF924 domain-containing protein [Pseudazoarcus pumilus]|nr:DUF924 domain-containing protein [Pseudazoarcus pumilus]